MNCPICNNAETKVSSHPTRDASDIDCPQCGQFTISRTAVVNLKNEDNSVCWKISAWINEFSPSMVTSTDVELARGCAVPSLHHRADRMLRWITNEFPPGKTFSTDDLGHWKAHENTPGESVVIIGGEVVSSRLMPIGWNRTIQEMTFMVTEVLCKEMGLLASPSRGQYQVSPKGLLYLEGRRESVSSVGFCAMWFNPEVLPLWTEVIESATREAGYEPLRIDSKQHNGKIDDEIMASIRASRFVVSDFTGSRGGVYYEAGFAHGLGLPVIFMCREGDELHFDVRQYNCIFWKQENLEDAKSQLKNRILATLGQGPKFVQ
jgi:hypothetical protein